MHPARAGGPTSPTLIREVVALPTETHALCADGTGYIRLPSFSRTTPAAHAAAVKALAAAGATRYVLDLRDNGGGVFPAAVEVARAWLPAGAAVVLIADAAGVRDAYEADGGVVAPLTAPLTVLVNRGTASAAEVLAGALRDEGRAVVAGEPTFGKGLIQTVVPLSDGSAVAVTVAKYQVGRARGGEGEGEGGGRFADLRRRRDRLPPPPTPPPTSRRPPATTSTRWASRPTCRCPTALPPRCLSATAFARRRGWRARRTCLRSRRGAGSRNCERGGGGGGARGRGGGCAAPRRARHTHGDERAPARRRAFSCASSP